MPNAYGDLKTLKSAAFLNVPDDTQDGRLLALLETASRWIDGYCDRQFAARHGERRFDGTGRTALAVPDLIAVSALRVREPATGVWVNWPSDWWLPYPLTAAPAEPGGRPYTRVLATAGGRRFPLSRGGVSIAGVWGYGDRRVDTGLRIATGAPAAADDATIAVSGSANDAAALSPGHTLRIDDEQLYITGVASGRAGALTLTAQRGVNGTVATAHAAGAGVAEYRYPPAVAEAGLLQAAHWWRERFTGPFLAPEGASLGDVAGVLPTARALLEPYRRRVATLGV